MSTIDDDEFQNCDICHKIKPMILIVQKLHLAICDDCLLDQYIQQKARIAELEGVEKGLRVALGENEQQRELDNSFADMHLKEAKARIASLEAALAKCEPWLNDDMYLLHCVVCDAHDRHSEDCLWLQAKKAQP